MAGKGYGKRGKKRGTKPATRRAHKMLKRDKNRV